MTTVLLTAFEPYDRWPENASWLALVELTRDLPAEPHVVTRRYPVDFDAARARLFDDLAANYDFALHLGQSPGSSRVHLEAIGVNVAAIVGLVWVAARVYRVGMLMYGKRATVPEVWKWIRQA